MEDLEERKVLGKAIVTLARKAIEYYLAVGRYLPIPDGCHPFLLRERRGVFVSLKKGKSLRGCIGTFLPQRANVAQEIISNAVSAAFQDPRFPPVDPSEMKEITISVDLLSPLEKVSDWNLLDPKRYGILVESGWKRGLLLPDLEGIDTVADQLRIARGKAGILPHEPLTIYRFEVERFREGEDEEN